MGARDNIKAAGDWMGEHDLFPSIPKLLGTEVPKAVDAVSHAGIGSSLSNYLRALGNDQQGETVANYLPLARSPEGKLHAAIPEVLRAALRGLGDANDLQATPDSVNLATAVGLGGLAGGPEVSGTEMAHGVFAGRKSRTANIPLAEKALGKSEDALSYATESSADQDRTPVLWSSALDANEAALNSTGWFMGPDLLQRYEIPDAKQMLKLPWAKYPSDYLPQDIKKDLKGRPYEGLKGWESTEQVDPGRQHIPFDSNFKLGDILDHKELFAAYPELKDMPVGSNGLFDFGSRGSYSPTEKKIRLGSASPTDMNSTLHHEIQHAVQDIEGFSNGGNTSMWKSPEVKVFEDETTALRDNVHKQISAAGFNPYTVHSIIGDMNDPKKLAFREKYYPAETAYAKNMTPMELKTMEDLRQRIDLVNKIGNELHNHYKNLAGETEARNVQTRLGEHPAGNDPPWTTQDVPYNKQGIWANNQLEDWNGQAIPDLGTKLNAMIKGLGNGG